MARLPKLPASGETGLAKHGKRRETASRTPSSGRGRFERQLPEARRQALIEAAIECLKRYGHEGLSVRRISAQAKVSIGLINHHFPGKNSLIAAAYRHFNSQLVSGLEAAVHRAADSPRARIRAFLEASFSPPNLDRDVLTVWIVFWGLHRHSREIQKVHDETYRGYVELLRGMLASLRQSASGAGPPNASEGPVPRNALAKGGFNLRLAATGLAALLDGLWLEWCLDPGNFRPREAVALCESWVESLCRGDGSC
jgi:AcrR family transcriptional regulator